MDLFPIIACIVVGLIAGFFAGLLGVGGGVVAVPLFSVLFTMLQFDEQYIMHIAIGTSLAALVFTGMVSTWAHNRRQAVLWMVVKDMLPGLIIGCLLGAFISNFLSRLVLEVIFGVCAIGLGINALEPWLLTEKRSRQQMKKTHLTWIAIMIGTIASLIGIGGGLLAIPFFMLMRYPEKKVIGTTAAVSLTITIFGALAYLYFGLSQDLNLPNTIGYIYIPAFSLVGLVSAAISPLGVYVAHKLPNKALRYIIGIFLICVGLFMLI